VPETSTTSADAAAEGRVEAEEEQLEQWEVHKGSFVYANAEQEGEPIGRLDPTHNEDHEVRLTGSRHPPGSGWLRLPYILEKSASHSHCSDGNQTMQVVAGARSVVNGRGSLMVQLHIDQSARGSRWPRFRWVGAANGGGGGGGGGGTAAGGMVEGGLVDVSWAVATKPNGAQLLQRL
jgi:hypothetical protein